MFELIVIFLADILIVPIVGAAAFIMLRLPVRRRWSTIGRGIVMALTALWFAKVASLFYQGTRPFIELGVDPRASFLPNPGFPSDHALLVFVAAFVVLASTGSRRLGMLFFGAAALVGFGRVLALVHSPLDVIGAFVCALFAAMIWHGPSLARLFVQTTTK